MRLYRAFATVGGLTMVSRVLGFIRDILIAGVLGSGAIADAFFVAFRFPNLFRRLFGEGAFNAAFVPLYTKKLTGEGEAAAASFAEQAMAGLLMILLLLSAICMLAMPWLMYGIAPGFAGDKDKFDLAIVLTQIAFPYLACMSLVALLSGMLNAKGKFVESSAVSIVLNLTLIAAILIAMALGYRNDANAGHALAWGVFAAGILQLLLLLDGARRNGIVPRLVRPVWNDDIKRLVTLGIPGVIAGGITQINILIGTIIATLQSGAVAHLYYADRVYELPLAIIGIAIGVVLLPEVSRALKAGDAKAVSDSQNRSLEFAMLLTVPAAVALSIIATPIVRVLYERGAFTAADTTATAAALGIFALGLPAFVLIKVFSPAYFAREDTRTPMRYAAISLTANTLGSAALFFGLREAGYMPHLGIAIATTLGGWLNAMLLWRGLARRGHFALDARCRSSLPRIVLASLAMGGLLVVLGDLLGPWLGPDSSLVTRSTALATLIGAGGSIYFAVAFGLGVLRREMIRSALSRRGGSQ
jgi:putative peptidoglycan lipid II flippase